MDLLQKRLHSILKHMATIQPGRLSSFGPDPELQQCLPHVWVDIAQQRNVGGEQVYGWNAQFRFHFYELQPSEIYGK